MHSLLGLCAENCSKKERSWRVLSPRLTPPARTACDCSPAGDCDATFAELAKLCGWLDDLMQYKHLMCSKSQALLESMSR